MKGKSRIYRQTNVKIRENIKQELLIERFEKNPIEICTDKWTEYQGKVCIALEETTNQETK